METDTHLGEFKAERDLLRLFLDRVAMMEVESFDELLTAAELGPLLEGGGLG